MKDTDALVVLIRCAGSQRRLADIISISPEHISRMRHGRFPVPAHLVALAEAMALLPQQDWPDRWHQ